MEPTEVLKLIAEIGPNGHEAFKMYMELQWAEFYALTGVLALCVVVIIFIVYRAVKSEY